MVFSVPIYLDPPNWQQQHPNYQQQLQGGNNENQHLMQPLQVQQHQPQMGMGGGGAEAQQIRPNSMAERARQANVPPLEALLKCPRCDSTNTKFCYFNNYSLTQPRHFCKTCRRYWTRGGSLRNVPVGGGCRRNKRSSTKTSSSGSCGGSSSKYSLSSPSSMVSGERSLSMNLVSSSSLNISSALNCISPGGSGIGGGSGMPFMASLQNIAQLTAFGGSFLAPSNPLGGLVGLTRAGGHDTNHNHHMELAELNHSQRQQVQFPNFLGGFEIPGSSTSGELYSSSFQNDNQGGVGEDDEQVHDMSQFAPVKMEDGPGLNLARQLMGFSSTSSDNNATNNNNQHQFTWGGNMTNNNNNDQHQLNSSSTSLLL